MKLLATRQVSYQSIHGEKLISNMTKSSTFDKLHDQKSGLKWSKMTEMNVNT